jgi:hypothetical protein
VEQVCYAASMGFDRARSRAAFERTVYPLLRANCARCHSTETAAQAPLHSDRDAALAHEYALTRVDLRNPENSKLVARMTIERHQCFGDDCRAAGARLLAAVSEWAKAVADTLPATPRPVPAGETIPEADVRAWIAADRAALPSADVEFTRYASLHALHNAGVSAEDLNLARVALSKALNSTARWAPEIVNPADIDGKGIVYRFDTRDYWGYNKGIARLRFGGSDDDLFFGAGDKTDAEGNPVTSIAIVEAHAFAPSVSEDENFARLVWQRVRRGSVEGGVESGSLPPNVDGFADDYVEASQLVYTLTRPDVYNAIMVIPWRATDLEDELGVVRDRGVDSYQYLVTADAITVDSRLYYRARTQAGGFYWKTFDVFSGQHDEAHPDRLRFPFWAHPIPKFIGAAGGYVTEESLSFIATLAQPLRGEIDGNQTLAEQCNPQTNYGFAADYYNCRYYTGQHGLQQSAEEVIWDLPNGLQGYALYGGFNQRRVDAFTNIVRDPRLQRTLSDEALNKGQGFADVDWRLIQGASCLGCHTDGLNRGNNDLRDWLEAGKLPMGETGADGWIHDEATKARVRELYPTSSEIRPQMEADRRIYLAAMAKIREAMVLGVDKNVHVEPIAWTFEWAQRRYRYPITRSN